MATVEIKFKDLREAVAALNETNLIVEKIKLVGSPKEVILQQFMDAMVKIPDDAEGKFPGPKVCLDFYNSILDAEEKAAKESETKPEAETTSTETPIEAKENKPVKPPKEKKEKVVKEKKEKVAKEKKQRTGWKEGSKCNLLHQLINNSEDKGISIEEALIESAKFGASENQTKSVFNECVRYNLAFKKENRFFKK